MYVFNLIIGVGALTMPKAFANAGWLIATVLTTTLCFMRLVYKHVLNKRENRPVFFVISLC